MYQRIEAKRGKDEKGELGGKTKIYLNFCALKFF